MYRSIECKSGISFISALAALFLVGSYADRHVKQSTSVSQEFEELCANPKASFGQSLRGDNPADIRMQERFGQVCQKQERQEGVEFGASQIVYTCRTFLPRMQLSDAYAIMDGFERAFGKRWHAGSFNSAASEPDDLRPRAYFDERRAIGGETFDKQIPIQALSLMAGLNVTFIMLADVHGDVQQTLATRADLDNSLRRVSTLEGAFALLDWYELVGLTKASVSAGVRPQCTAKSISRAENGWQIMGVEVIPNCRPSRERDFIVDRSGAVQTLSDKAISNHMTLCVD